MVNLRKAERVARAEGFAAFIGLLVLLEWGLYQHHNEQVAQGRLLALTFASSLRADVDRELNSLFTLTASLSSYLEVRAAHDRIDDAEINALLANLYKKSRHVLNFGLAIGYRLTYVYPLQGNEKAVGLYYPDEPAQWPAVERSVASEKGVLAGPTSLVQGGSGLIYRVPVRVDGRYWGLLSTVIDAPGMFRTALQHELPEQVDFAIRGRDGLGAKGAVFWGDAHLFDDPKAVQITAEIPGGQWVYAVRIPLAANRNAELLQHMLVFFASALIGFFIYQLQRKRYELALAARIDPLTHLANRREFEIVIAGALERRRKLDQGDFSLLFLDLDRFKFINDTYGHGAGDAVLVAVARRIRKILRDADVIARWGGDEFVVLVRNSSPQIIAGLIERTRIALADPIVSNGIELSIGVAIGVATYPEDGDNVRALFHVADERMYRDKQLNRRRES